MCAIAQSSGVVILQILVEDLMRHDGSVLESNDAVESKIVESSFGLSSALRAGGPLFRFGDAYIDTCQFGSGCGHTLRPLLHIESPPRAITSHMRAPQLEKDKAPSGSQNTL